LLKNAVERRSPFTALQLATVSEDGAPKLRTIILRGFDPAHGTVAFITDRRAPKVREIGIDARVSLAGYDPLSNLQLRMEGTAAIVEDESEREAVWASLRPHTHILFRTPFAPGMALEAQDAALVPENAYSIATHEHYCLIRVSINLLELLDLSSEPHSRNRFTRGRQGWTGGRIAP